MSISNILDIASTGLTAQRIALDITGENITNVNTPGYSRQTASLETGTTTVLNGLAMGNGVQVPSIKRYFDSFLQNQLITGNSENGFATTSDSAMQMVQPLFNELSTSASGGLGSELQGFFAAWQDLASNPQGVAERQAVLSKGKELVDAFHRISGNLTNIQNSMDQALPGITADINSDLKQIADLNVQIRMTEAQASQANELRDKRDLLVQQLAQKVGVSAVEQSDGSLTVKDLNGDTLVSGKDYGSFSLQPNAGNNGYNDIMVTPVGGGTINATAFIGGPGNTQGALGGTLNVRDTAINKYLGSLDELASTLATQVNNANASGFGLTGSTGVNFFNAATTAAGLAVTMTSPDDIAASSTDPTTAAGGTGNNLNAQKIADIYDTTYPMTGGTMTMADFYTSVVGTVGVDVQAATKASDQSTATMNQLGNLRDSESGVSLDEELTNLTRYQAAYQGAAKLVTVGSDMLDTLIAMVR